MAVTSGPLAQPSQPRAASSSPQPADIPTHPPPTRTAAIPSPTPSPMPTAMSRQQPSPSTSQPLMICPSPPLTPSRPPKTAALLQARSLAMTHHPAMAVTSGLWAPRSQPRAASSSPQPADIPTHPPPTRTAAIPSPTPSPMPTAMSRQQPSPSTSQPLMICPSPPLTPSRPPKTAVLSQARSLVTTRLRRWR